jgi:hypothetical protein
MRYLENDDRELNRWLRRDTRDFLNLLETGLPSQQSVAAHILAKRGAAEAVIPLLRKLEETLQAQDFKTHASFRKTMNLLIERLTALPQPEYLPYFVAILKERQRFQLDGKPIAQAVATIARIWSPPELREVLPYLADFPGARKMVEAALHPGAQFPIPAGQTATTMNLPLPAEGAEPDADNLPTPTVPPEPKRVRPWWKWWTR